MLVSKNNAATRTSPDVSEQLKHELLAIAKVACPLYRFFGHGAPSLEHADNIMRDGLYLKYGLDGVTSTAIDLYPRTEIDDTMAMLKAWPHRNFKAIVLLAFPEPVLPPLPDGTRRMDRELISYVEPNPRRESRFDLCDSHIPANYVLGVIDAESMKLKKNPQFLPRPGPIENSEWHALELRNKIMFKNRFRASSAIHPAVNALPEARPDAATKQSGASPEDWIE